MDPSTLVANLGFPIAIAVYLLWQLREERHRCDEEMRRLREEWKEMKNNADR